MAAQTPQTHLDDAAIERLADLLDQRAVPHRGFNLEALDGYLSALAVSPGEPMPMEEWEPAVWGTPPRWDDAEERTSIERLLQAHHAMATARVRHDGDSLPDHLAPLLWLPTDEEAEAEENLDELDVGRDWALGFFTAVELREMEWEQWLDDHDWIDHAFELLDRLASGEVMAEDPTAEGTPLAYRDRLEIIAGLPDILADLNHHRVQAMTPREPVRREEAPGRNDPCTCGSGKKYKKCCGAD